MSEMIKNIEKEKVFKIAEAVAYEEGGVSSLTLAQKPGVGITILAFDAGEGVSSHAAPGDALVVVLEGEAIITIDGRENHVGAGDSVVMPAGIPHAVKALTKYKMLFTVVKE